MLDLHSQTKADMNGMQEPLSSGLKHQPGMRVRAAKLHSFASALTIVATEQDLKASVIGHLRADTDPRVLEQEPAAGTSSWSAGYQCQDRLSSGEIAAAESMTHGDALDRMRRGCHSASAIDELYEVEAAAGTMSGATSTAASALASLAAAAADAQRADQTTRAQFPATIAVSPVATESVTTAKNTAPTPNSAAAAAASLTSPLRHHDQDVVYTKRGRPSKARPSMWTLRFIFTNNFIFCWE